MPNFLMISIDDLFSVNAWPEFASMLQTPNLNAFAAGATNFTAAYASVALCNPSRSSILSGYSPMVSGILANSGSVFDAVPKQDILLSRLHEAGLSVAIGGKVFHEHSSPKMDYFVDTYLEDGGYLLGYNDQFDDTFGNVGDSGSVVLADDTITQSVVEFLQQSHTDPFALAAGLFRPHAPWRVPQAFFDLYDRDAIPVPYFGDDTEGMADFYYALTGSALHQRVLDNDAWVDLIHGYLASVSYADYLFGQMIDALDASPYGADTQVVVWSDHGYHLGDRGIWAKFTLWEESGRAPLMIREAGQTEGAVVDTPVSLMDIYPTVLELMGIEGGFRGHGHSLVPLLAGHDPSAFEGEGVFTWMYGGYSLRLGDYRYIRNEDGSEELYNLSSDLHQTHNLIDDAASASVLANMRAALPDVPGFSTFIGTAGDDNFTGTDGADLFLVGAGADHAAGGLGDDRYVLYDAATIIEDLNGGYDTVLMGKGINRAPDNIEAIYIRKDATYTTFFGNASNNDIYSNKANHKFYAGAGDDHFYGVAKNQIAYGQDGNDVLDGGVAADTLYGDAGDDTLLGGNGKDTLHGGTGADKLDGGAGNDLMWGEEDNDTLVGGFGADKLDGGDGNDVLLGGIDADTLAGGAGDDVLDGGFGADHLDGGEGVDKLSGGVGVDTLVGGDGDDTLSGGSENDTLDGSVGYDTLSGGDGDDVLSGGTDNDDLAGDDGADRMYGEQGADNLSGGIGNDVLKGGAENDTLSGGDGNDILDGGVDSDLIYGDLGNDLLIGGAGIDVMYGGDGADRLNGGAGNDRMYGGDGNDTILLGYGSDYARGGYGADRFFLDVIDGVDKIIDFAPGIDKIDLAKAAFASFADLQAHFTQSGADLLIDLGGGSVISLTGIQASELSATDFIL